MSRSFPPPRVTLDAMTDQALAHVRARRGDTASASSYPVLHLPAMLAEHDPARLTAGVPGPTRPGPGTDKQADTRREPGHAPIPSNEFFLARWSAAIVRHESQSSSRTFMAALHAASAALATST